MKRIHRRSSQGSRRGFALALSCFLGACGSSTGNGGGADGGQADGGGAAPGTTPSLVASPGQLALRVEKARRPSTDGKSGDLQVRITLANGIGGAPVPLNALLFNVKTDAGILFAGAPVTGTSWVGGPACSAAVSISEGASYTCALAFSLEGLSLPIALSYSTPATLAPGALDAGLDQRTVTEPLNVEACVTCGSACTYTDVDELNCGACGVDIASQSGLECRSGAVACTMAGLSPCGTIGSGIQCVDLTKNPHNCGACGHELQSGQVCSGSSTSCAPGLTSCSGNCVDLKSDRANCGACGALVPDAHTCTNGASTCVQGTACGGACVDLQTDLDNCGACGAKVPTGGACVGGVKTCWNSTQCGTACIDLTTSFSNCGSCGHACPPSQLNTCAGSQCF